MVFEIRSVRACVMTRASAKSVDASKPKVIRATASAAVGGLNPRGTHSKIAVTQPTHRTRSRALAWLFALLASIVFWSATSTAWSLEVDCGGEVTYGWGEEKLQRDNAQIHSQGGWSNGCRCFVQYRAQGQSHSFLPLVLRLRRYRPINPMPRPKWSL